MDYELIPPDIQQNQKENKLRIRSLMEDIPKEKMKLLKLLDARLHYFDEGYFCKYTPEELDKEIKKEYAKEA
jgi:hypothetical protein